MPANFTEEERKEIKERLIALGYDLIREMGLKKMKVSTIAEQAVRWFRDSFRPENNILMELTFDDWVWLKSHRTEDGMFSALHDEREAKRYLAYVDGIRPDLDVRVIINFFKTIYSMTEW